MTDPVTPVFGRPEDWDQMSDEQKKEWALGLLATLGVDVKQLDKSR